MAWESESRLLIPRAGEQAWASGGVQARRTQATGISEERHLPNIQITLLHEVFSVSVTLFSDTQYLLPVASVGCCHLGWGVRGTSRLFVVVQSSNRVRLFVIPGTEACQASLSLTISWSLPKFMSVESVMPSNCLILCHPLPLLPSIFPSIRVFSNESALRIKWPKYWSFSFNISECSGLISFRMDWLHLLAVQGTDSQESSPTPQFRSINCSAQLSLQSNSHIHT